MLGPVPRGPRYKESGHQNSAGAERQKRTWKQDGEVATSMKQKILRNDKHVKHLYNLCISSQPPELTIYESSNGSEAIEAWKTGHFPKA